MNNFLIIAIVIYFVLSIFVYYHYFGLLLFIYFGQIVQQLQKSKANLDLFIYFAF